MDNDQNVNVTINGIAVSVPKTIYYCGGKESRH